MRNMVALFATVAIAACAQDDPQGGNPVLLSEAQAYQQDAEAYVDAFGGTIEEAVRRLKLQPQIADLEETLEQMEPDTFAGLWIEHLPSFRVVVQLTHGGKDVVAQYTSNEELLDAIEVRTGRYTHANMRARSDAVIRAMERTGIPFEAQTRVQDGKIEVYVQDAPRLNAALQRENVRLPENAEVVTVDALAVPQVNWYGGRALAACTEGLSIIKSGTKYASSAAHCSAGSVSPLTIYTSYLSGAYDFSVLKVPSGDTIKNWVADTTFDSTPYYRVITGYTSRGSVGAVVCKYGKTTKYTCGTIENRYYTYNGSATYILVKSTSTTVKISCGGDSGAAWFASNIAHGNHVAGWCDLNNNKAIYMPVQGLTDKGYYPMTGP